MEKYKRIDVLMSNDFAFNPLIPDVGVLIVYLTPPRGDFNKGCSTSAAPPAPAPNDFTIFHDTLRERDDR
ncbi:hypothetical protein EVAR_62795_1 [Eumeta japonica]|uniref:Uncharacterized protein n=1 Tax=Eumeta variegata TaxID=151549 RepID=A0A4C1ZDU8_EUMVA|nr:hypothetical protein EVAR_62795_1 [Eumeta japonica]